MRKISTALLAAGLAFASTAAMAHPYGGYGYSYGPEVLVAPAPIVTAPVVAPYPGYVTATTVYPDGYPQTVTTYAAPAYAAPAYAPAYVEPAPGLVVAPSIGLRIR
jgi:hypothetical protein